MIDPGSPQYRSLLSPLEEEEDQSGLESELQGIRKEITVIADKIRADAATAKLESEWKFAAMVSQQTFSQYIINVICTAEGSKIKGDF